MPKSNSQTLDSVAKKALTVKQFCAKYNISRSKLYQLWSVGRGPPRVKIGRRTLIPVEAAEEWFAGLVEAKPKLSERPKHAQKRDAADLMDGVSRVQR